MSAEPSSPDAFTIERHGDVLVIEPSPAFEGMEPAQVDAAAALLSEPLRGLPAPQVIFDLHRVDYFGSAFLALLLRCWKLVSHQGGQMALAGVTGRVMDLLRITRLNTVWPIYDGRREAIEALLAD